MVSTVEKEVLDKNYMSNVKTFFCLKVKKNEANWFVFSPSIRFRGPISQMLTSLFNIPGYCYVKTNTSKFGTKTMP